MALSDLPWRQGAGAAFWGTAPDPHLDEPQELIPVIVTLRATKVGIQCLADWIPTFVARSVTAIAGLNS
jgi:hypothetical protein